MPYQIAADAIVVIHFIFILFVISGGFLAIRWRWLIWLHIPAASWGVLAISLRWVCPLTPLENSLRRAGGGDSYGSGFIEHYLVPIIYPSGFDDSVFMAMGVGVVILNVIAYSLLFVSARQWPRCNDNK